MLPSVNIIEGEKRGYAEASHGQVHYREMGAGPALLLVHQAPWSSIQYRKAMPLLARAGYRVIAPDLPGHGMSNPPAGEPIIEEYARSMMAVVESLGLKQVAVAGHHGGALVAAHMAAEYPDRIAALITDNIPFYTEAQRQERLSGLVDLQDIKADGSHLSDRWAVTRRVADPEWSDETIHIGTIAYFAHGPWKEHGHKAAPRYDLEMHLERIICPTLIIASQKDRLYPSGKRLIERRPDWDYAELTGASAMVFERTDEWAAPIISFLNRLNIA